MAAYINTNISSLNAQRNLETSQSALATSLQRLSSGLRINSAKDDAAGLAITQRMTSQINGSDQAARNANDGISLAQTAEGDLAQIGTNLQRMRELAVQASNGTNSASDRAALNGEAQSLAAEIDRVSQNSSFNGVKLLDGSFSSQNFQIGANNTANDHITINAISSARTSALGGVGTSFASTITTGKTTGAIAAGDVTLNGFQVGASAIGAAPGQSTGSAYSVAAAINQISANSGVTAVANTNNVTGVAASTPAALAAGTFNINGVDVGAVAAATSSAGQGANVAAAINKISSQTGVTATADAVSGAVTMTAADGRDVNLALDPTSASPTTTTTAALAAKATFLANTGLTADKAAAAVAGATISASTITLATSTLSGTIAAGALTANGIALGAITLTAGAFAANGQAIATAITNALALAPGGAAANGTATYAANSAGTAATITFSQATTLGVGLVATNAAAADANTANLAAGLTGLTAAQIGTQAAGTNTTNHGTISLSSTSANGIVYGGGNLAFAGLAAAGGAVASTTTSSVSSLASMNLLTSAGAASALSAIDGALDTVNASRSSLGAYQNRFASIVTTLQTSSENLSASRSRIEDTDFAKETASLTRGQILQQAGTAMLAQANSLPNGVLALLRG